MWHCLAANLETCVCFHVSVCRHTEHTKSPQLHYTIATVAMFVYLDCNSVGINFSRLEYSFNEQHPEIFCKLQRCLTLYTFML